MGPVKKLKKSSRGSTSSERSDSETFVHNTTFVPSSSTETTTQGTALNESEVERSSPEVRSKADVSIGSATKLGTNDLLHVTFGGEEGEGVGGEVGGVGGVEGEGKGVGGEVKGEEGEGQGQGQGEREGEAERGSQLPAPVSTSPTQSLVGRNASYLNSLAHNS